MVIAIAVSLLFGLALTLIGLRGRRTDDHPLCRRCRFDLTGRASDAERRCPECGADLSRPRAVVVGHRRRRPVLAANGLVLLVSAIAIEVDAVRRWSTTDFWYPYMPAMYLIHEAGSADPARHDPAMGELVKRYDAGGWSAWTGRAVADAALACQRDAAASWDPRCGDLLERMRADGRLSDDRWATYAAQAGFMLTMQVRPVVPSGDPLPFTLGGDWHRAASGTRLWWALRQKSGICTVDSGVGGAAVRVHVHDGRVDAADLTPLRPDGSLRNLTCRIDVVVGDGNAASGHHTLAVRRATASGRFTLAAADRPAVTAVPDPAAAGIVRRSLTVAARWEADRRHGNPPAVVIQLHSERTPCDVSFAVAVRCDGREYPVGTLVHGRESLGIGTYLACPPAVGHPRSVDVIFRADPSPAATTTTDISTVWGGEVVFAGVPVE